MITRFHSVVLALPVLALSCVSATSQAPDPTAEIIVSAVHHLRAEQTGLPSEGKIEGRTEAVAAALRRASAQLKTEGLSIADRGAAFSCDPDPCGLRDAELVFRVGDPEIDGDEATVMVEVIRAMPEHEHRRYFARLFRVELVRRNGAWTATQSRLRVIT